jgi:CheY-like chemotaxis protein
LDKNCNKNSECPVLAATAFMTEEVFENAKKVGIRHVLAKPVKKEELFKIIKKYFFGS